MAPTTATAFRRINDNDLTCRDTIEAMLGDLERSDSDEFERFRRRIRVAAEKFRNPTKQDPFRAGERNAWQRRLIVKMAGNELAADLRSQYGVAVTIVDGGPTPP